jgi:hypothetical protein
MAWLSAAGDPYTSPKAPRYHIRISRTICGARNYKAMLADQRACEPIFVGRYLRCEGLSSTEAMYVFTARPCPAAPGSSH